MRLVTCLLAGSTLAMSLGAFGATPSSWERATQLYESGNYSGALSEINKMPGDRRANPSVHYLIGMCYKRMGKADLAKRELTWVASYSRDVNTKELARIALEQLPSARQPRAGQEASPGRTSTPPAKILIHDSVSETLSAAAKSGWRPCTGKCLNANTPGWHHEHVEGHSDSENWHTFPGTGNPRAVTTAHWGEVFDENPNGAISRGACPTCGGTGWVRAK